MSGEIPFGRFSKDKRGFFVAPLSLDYISAPTVYDALNQPRKPVSQMDLETTVKDAPTTNSWKQTLYQLAYRAYDAVRDALYPRK